MKHISTDEAEALLDENVPYVDVRTVEEFEDGHVPGALNVPIAHASGGKMVENPDFLRVMEAHFAKNEKFIVACKAGGRSARAAATLAQAGFSEVLDMTAGFVGKKGTFGDTIPGWSAEGREVSLESAREETYEALKSEADLENSSR